MCKKKKKKKTHVINNVTISYPSLLKILQTGLLQLIRASRIHFVSVRVTSTASKRSPDLNWHTQYEKLLLHITKSTDTDQTSRLVNSVAQKKNRGLNFVLSLSSPCHSWCHQDGTRFLLHFLASHPITTSRGRRDSASSCVSIFVMRKHFSTVFPVDFPLVSLAELTSF